ncbi:MAG: hypothetical protein CV087_21800, partial [Candidatus Brocadia sp. WS118]
MKNVIIDVPARIEDRIEDFKLDAVDEEHNYTAAKVKLCREPDSGSPVVFYSQELSRNFKNPNDRFNRRHLIKVFTPSNVTAVADNSLQQKFQDTILAFKPKIDDYSPLTDIHSQSMNLFMDEQTAQFLNDTGINIDGLGEDFQSIESVSATPYMEDVSFNANHFKTELRQLQARYLLIKEEMAKEFEDHIDPRMVSDEVFARALAQENVSQGYVQTYLNLR